jgi:hypothetical protein
MRRSIIIVDFSRLISLISCRADREDHLQGYDISRVSLKSDAKTQPADGRRTLQSILLRNGISRKVAGDQAPA